ncbi:cytochrome C assembly family protein [Mannheimia massilioguelmaensis]|uniref:cytochrome C assembly family protein n=1 Tax=Mannheimia massilioguelmaensis TaxID=1604354 RepID=UPI0005C7F1A9|nr:cytochrome c biogenesis protein CcsA [Mannheimia massilioguelmaensis]
MWFSILSIVFYVLALLLIAPILLNTKSVQASKRPQKLPLFITALCAIVFHIFSIYPLLTDLVTGQNFTLLEIGSLFSVIIAIFATLFMLRVNTMWLLLPIVYAFAIINIVAATFIPSHIIQLLNQNTSLLFHIGLSVFTYALCFIAMLYSIQLVWIDRSLKARKTQFSPAIPPLMTVERHFFCLFTISELLLTFTLISGTYHLLQSINIETIHKAAFSCAGWLIFGIGLVGHWKYHWKGKKMIVYTISGMILLTIAYFGSRLISS